MVEETVDCIGLADPVLDPVEVESASIGMEDADAEVVEDANSLEDAVSDAPKLKPSLVADAADEIGAIVLEADFPVEAELAISLKEVEGSDKLGTSEP